MKPIKNWRAVLKKAWSVRLMILAAVLAGVEVILPFLTPTRPGIGWSLFTFCIVCGALLSRFVAQSDVSDHE